LLYFRLDNIYGSILDEIIVRQVYLYHTVVWRSTCISITNGWNLQWIILYRNLS